ncbi:MAG: MBL fold metallo-hydrolase, partial [Nanoarchaeota archaeon]
HIASLRHVIANTKSLVIITNKSVGKLLDKEGIFHEVVEDGASIVIKGVTIRADGDKHTVIHASLPAVQNTGYFIGERFYYPGDDFHKPKKKVEILALPVAGPWMKLSEAIDYALDIKPKVCIPVHDGLLTEQGKGAPYRITEKVLAEANIQFLRVKEKETQEF